MHNLPLLVSGPARCTAHVHPTTPSGSASSTARRRACARARARSRCPSRSPTTSCPASSRSRTAGATTRRARCSRVAQRPARRELQRARRRAAARAAVGHRGAQRDPGRACAGDRGGARRRASVGRIRRAARHVACRRSAAGPYPTDRVPAFNANPQRHGSKLGPTFAQGCRNCSVSSNSGVSPALARGSARAFKQKRGRVATSARPLADSPIKKARCPINLAAGTLLRRPSASHPGPRPCRAEPWSRPPITLRRRRRP